MENFGPFFLSIEKINPTTKCLDHEVARETIWKGD